MCYTYPRKLFISKWPGRRPVCILTAVVVLALMSSPAGADYHIEITPMIVVGENYDDNIDSENRDEESDYITTISPGIKIEIDSHKNGLSLDYAPTWARYHKNKDNNAVRQTGSLSLWRSFGKHLRFDLRESYLRSEESIEAERETQRIRRTRDIYERNDIDTNLNYQFGPEDHLTIGYHHGLLENDDPTMEDSTEHGPSGTLSYWFNIRNGIELGYGFSGYRFDREEGAASSDDIDSHEADVSYIHRFGPRTRARVNYGLGVRNFREEPVDYQVHDGSVGLEKDFSSRTSLSLELGFYEPTGDLSEDTGIECAAGIERKIKHGSITLGIRKGWDEDYMDAEKRDFTEYWSTQARIEYDIFENLHIYAGGSYRNNSYTMEETEDDETYEGRCGLVLEFLRRFSLALGYTRLDRKSDDPDDEYVDNMIMVTLSASRPFKWVR